jgi:hypothetical protein
MRRKARAYYGFLLLAPRLRAYYGFLCFYPIKSPPCEGRQRLQITPRGFPKLSPRTSTLARFRTFPHEVPIAGLGLRKPRVLFARSSLKKTLLRSRGRPATKSSARPHRATPARLRALRYRQRARVQSRAKRKRVRNNHSFAFVIAFARVRALATRHSRSAKHPSRW